MRRLASSEPSHLRAPPLESLSDLHDAMAIAIDVTSSCGRGTNVGLGGIGSGTGPEAAARRAC